MCVVVDRVNFGTEKQNKKNKSIPSSTKDARDATLWIVDPIYVFPRGKDFQTPVID